MTPATKTIRETAARYRGRALIVEVNPHVITCREKGRRDRVDIPYEAIYELGLKLRYRQQQAEKKKARRAA
jgi:hypothetical protein